jgi:hypothetical protein
LGIASSEITMTEDNRLPSFFDRRGCRRGGELFHLCHSIRSPKPGLKPSVRRLSPSALPQLDAAGLWVPWQRRAQFFEASTGHFDDLVLYFWGGRCG